MALYTEMAPTVLDAIIHDLRQNGKHEAVRMLFKNTQNKKARSESNSGYTDYSCEYNKDLHG